MIDFPIANLFDDSLCLLWLERHLHPNGFVCPHCGSADRRLFRCQRHYDAYRCRNCDGYYTLLSGTVFEGSRKRPATFVLLLQGIAKGEPTARLARELHLSRQTVHARRYQLQSNLNQSAPTDTVAGQMFEVDEIYQNAGKKARRIATRMTHPAAARISSRDTAPMITTDRRSFISSAARRAKSAAGWLHIATRRPAKAFSPKLFQQRGRSSTPTSIAVTMGSSRNT